MLEQMYMWGVRHASFQVMFFCEFPFWYKLSLSLAVRRRSQAKGSWGRAYFCLASCQSKWSMVLVYITSPSLKNGFNMLAATLSLTVQESGLTHLCCLCLTVLAGVWGHFKVTVAGYWLAELRFYYYYFLRYYIILILFIFFILWHSLLISTCSCQSFLLFNCLILPLLHSQTYLTGSHTAFSLLTNDWVRILSHPITCWQ